MTALSSQPLTSQTFNAPEEAILGYNEEIAVTFPFLTNTKEMVLENQKLLQLKV